VVSVQPAVIGMASIVCLADLNPGQTLTVEKMGNCLVRAV
jgi:hypothetical protein